MTFGTAKADNWAGGTASSTGTPTFQVQYTGTDANGVAYYNVVSADNGYGTQVLRVLAPTNPAPGVPHNFLYVLPVEGGLASDYGDGIDTLRALDAQDQYNLTIIEPTFADRSVVRRQSQRSESPVRDLHDQGSGAVGDAEPVDDRSRAELADRLLEVRHRRQKTSFSSIPTSSRLRRRGTSLPT